MKKVLYILNKRAIMVVVKNRDSNQDNNSKLMSGDSLSARTAAISVSSQSPATFIFKGVYQDDCILKNE